MIALNIAAVVAVELGHVDSWQVVAIGLGNVEHRRGFISHYKTVLVLVGGGGLVNAAGKRGVNADRLLTFAHLAA